MCALDLVLALPLDEVHPGHALLDRELAHRAGEGVRDFAQRCRGGDRQAQLLLHVPADPARILQLWNVDVEKHSVQALDLEERVLGDDIGHGAR